MRLPSLKTLSGAALVAALLIVGTNLVLRQRLDHEARGDDRSPGSARTPTAQAEIPKASAPPAIAGSAARETQAGSAPETEAVPGKLPRPDDAAPIGDGGSGDDDLSTIIEQELPDASAAERRIWREELRGMPPARARELLRLREQFGPAGDAAAERLFGPDRFAPEPMLDPGTPPAEPPPPSASDFSAEAATWLEPTLAALRQARDVHLNNAANAHTPGFKRLDVLFTDGPYVQAAPAPSGSDAGEASVAVGQGLRLAGTTVDLAPGPLRETGRPLDLAVEGSGFFRLSRGQRTVYTRAGRFAVGENGTLIRNTAGERWTLTPSVSVPAEAREIHVAPDGAVMAVVPGADEPEPCGHIELARFRNAERLIPQGHCFFAATARSGEARMSVPGTDGCGHLLPGHLEGSNVVLDEELAALEEISTQRRALVEARSLFATPPEGFAHP